jgi:uncharacterized protein
MDHTTIAVTLFMGLASVVIATAIWFWRDAGRLGSSNLGLLHDMGRRTFPSFLIYFDDAGEWRWRFDASANDPILQSDRGFATIGECKQSIARLESHSDKEIWYLDPSAPAGPTV